MARLRAIGFEMPGRSSSGFTIAKNPPLMAGRARQKLGAPDRVGATFRDEVRGNSLPFSTSRLSY